MSSCQEQKRKQEEGERHMSSGSSQNPLGGVASHQRILSRHACLIRFEGQSSLDIFDMFGRCGCKVSILTLVTMRELGWAGVGL